nr:nucleic acid-binding, OB-fold protein [Tanacetum cinerariifolium]
GNIIQLALWHEMALTFNITEYEDMEKPVIIAITSCWVRHFNDTLFELLHSQYCNNIKPSVTNTITYTGLQLSATSATHYYLNPNILETYHIKEHNQVDSLIKDCNELLAELSDKNPYNLPSALKELEVEHAEPKPKPISPELPQPVILTEVASPSLSRTASNEFDPQLNITSPSQQSPTKLGQPEDQVIQSTPNPTEAHKGNKPSNPTAPSARKALFKDTSEIEFPQSRPNRKLIHNSILNGPYVRQMIAEPGDAERDVNVNETFHEQTDDELSERELKQIEADDQAIQTILL